MHKIFAKTLFIGKQVVSLPTCHSTNDVASEMSAKGHLHEGAVIITENQTKGRGQRGNSWESAPGQNLTFTVVLRPKFIDVHHQFDLNRIVSLAIHHVLTEDLGLDSHKVRVKWPNDIYVNTKKICGILIENMLGGQKLSQSLVGIGINVNQVDFSHPQATSIRNEANEIYELEEILELILLAVEKWYLILKAGKIDALCQAYDAVLYQKGDLKLYQDEKGVKQGVIEGTNRDGVLSIYYPEIALRKEYHFKEVSFL